MAVTSIAFLLCFFGGLLLALFRQPIYGLYVYIAVFYLDPPTRWWGQALPEVRWSFVAALVTLAAAVFHARGRRGHPSIFSQTPFLLYLAFVGWMWVTTLWAVDSEAHWFGLEVYTKYVLVILLIYMLVDNRERLGAVLLAHALGCFYLGYLAWTSGSGGGRLDGIGGPGINDSNSLAMQMGTAVFAAAAFYFARSGWRRYLAVPAVPFALNTLVMAGSRGGFLALLAGGLVFYFFRPAGQLRVVLPYAIVGALLLGYLASDTFIARMSTLTKPVESQASADLSVETRLVLIDAQLRMARNHPLGVGNGGTAYLSTTYMDSRYHSGGARASHNSFLSALVEQGFPGAAIWLAILVTLVWRLRANRVLADRAGDLQVGWLNTGIASMLAVVIVAGLFSPQARTEIYVWLLALTCVIGNTAIQVVNGRVVRNRADRVRDAVHCPDRAEQR